ncbi:MAG: hypothetical protein WBO08_17900 [Mycobacterium sp.]|nr:hypothetical protein [Mycobacterium sp.]
MSSPGVGAYIAQVDRLLGAGQGLFPQGGPAVGAVSTGGDRVPAAPPGVSGLSLGAGGAAQDYRGTASEAAGLDGDVTATTRAAKATGQNGRADAAAVRHTAQSAAAAIAPATGSPAGMKVLVSTMDDRLADMQRHIDTAKAQNDSQAARLHGLADRYRALETAYVPPKPPPTIPGGSLCWIGTKDGDVHTLCPSDTDTVTYVDDDGNYVAKTLPGGEVTIIHRPGPVEGDPTVCWLPHAGADRSMCGPAASSWMYPNDGFLITEETGADGKIHIVFQTPLGPLNP